MPATINGIGTNYIGKRHIEKHVGVCEKCGQTVTLTSYETRTWFVILFIPIIPLGRKMVLDYCPKCTAHRVVPLVEWQRIKDEAVADALRKTKEHPDDAAAAARRGRRRRGRPHPATVSPPCGSLGCA